MNSNPLYQVSDLDTFLTDDSLASSKSSTPNVYKVFFRRGIGSQKRRVINNLQEAITEFISRCNEIKSQNETPGFDFSDSYDFANLGISIIDIDTGNILDANSIVSDMHGYSQESFIGLHISSITHPVSQRIFSEYIQPIGTENVFKAFTVNLCQDGTTFLAEIFGIGIFYKEQLCLLNIIHKTNNMVESNKLLMDWIDERYNEQSTLLRILQSMASMFEFDPDFILDQLSLIIPYSHAIFFVIEENSLNSVAINGLEQKTIHINQTNQDSLNKVFGKNRAVCLSNFPGNDPMGQYFLSLFKDSEKTILEGVQSWLWIPVKAENCLLGCIGIAQKIQGYFNFHHASLALTIANQAAITIDNAKINKNEQMAGVMQERQKLAHYLHDTVNQSLFSAGLIAEVLPHVMDKDPDEWKHYLVEIFRLIRGAQAEIRMMLVDLKPSTMADVELYDLLHLLAKAFMGRTNIPIDINVLGKCTLPAKVKTAIYHICQEALNNIAKHSEAKKAEISLRIENEEINLFIRDDGRGFDRRRQGVRREKEPVDLSIRDNNCHGFNPKYIPFGHYGLRMMYDNADSIGADMKIISQPGHGTQISVQWKGSS